MKTTMDKEQLARLYVGERLSAAEVAQRIGCSETTVRRRLHSHALDVRSRGPRLRAPTTDGRTRERAYAVGLLATDGNLSRDGRHLTVTSADPDLLGVLQACLRLQANVRRVGPQGRCYRIQWSDRRFYDWVESIGLSPAKGRTLGALSVPDEYFADFARGCIDGDGSIVVYVDRYHSDRNARYVYERLYVTLVSAKSTVRRLVQGQPATIRGNPRLGLGENVTVGPPVLGASLCTARVQAIAALDLLCALPSVPGAQEGTI